MTRPRMEGANHFRPFSQSKHRAHYAIEECRVIVRMNDIHPVFIQPPGKPENETNIQSRTSRYEGHGNLPGMKIDMPIAKRRVEKNERILRIPGNTPLGKIQSDALFSPDLKTTQQLNHMFHERKSSNVYILGKSFSAGIRHGTRRFMLRGQVREGRRQIQGYVFPGPRFPLGRHGRPRTVSCHVRKGLGQVPGIR